MTMMNMNDDVVDDGDGDGGDVHAEKMMMIVLMSMIVTYNVVMDIIMMR